MVVMTPKGPSTGLEHSRNSIKVCYWDQVEVLATGREGAPLPLCWEDGWWSARREQCTRQGLFGTLLPLSCNSREEEVTMESWLQEPQCGQGTEVNS